MTTSIAANVTAPNDVDSAPISSSEVEQRYAEEFEHQHRKEATIQFQRLKDEAHALYGMVEGRPGVTSLGKLQELLEKAGDDIGSGRFILRFLGAERYLDVVTMAALLTLRQNLIAEIGNPTTADVLMVDAAVVAYYNFLRVQGWIGNLALLFEREAFGQRSMNEIDGPTAGEQLREQLERLSEVILPLQDRCHRMMIRSLAQLRPVTVQQGGSRNRD